MKTEFINKLLNIDLKLSKNLLLKYNKKNINDSLILEEIQLLSYDFINIIEDNFDFFKKLNNQITIIINTNKKRFYIEELDRLDMDPSYYYTNIIIRSLITIQFKERKNLSYNNMINRNMVVNNIRVYSRGLVVLADLKEKYIIDKILAVIIGLTTQNFIKKLIKKEKMYILLRNKDIRSLGDINTSKKSKTVIYLKFQIDNKIKYSRRIESKIYTDSPIYKYNYSISNSNLSLEVIIKKSKHQKKINNISIAPLIKMSKKPFIIDWDIWEKYRIYIIKDRIEDINKLLDHSSLNKSISEFNELADNLYLLIEERELLLNQLYSKAVKIRNKEEREGLKVFKSSNELFRKYYSDRKIIYLLKIKLQQLFYDCVLEKLPRNKAVYISYFRDFRGRIYPNNLYHPMYIRNIRSSIIIKTKSRLINHRDFEKIKKTKFYNKIMKLAGDLILDNNTEWFLKKIKKKEDLFMFLVHMYEIGKLIEIKNSEADKGFNLKDFIKRSNILFGKEGEFYDIFTNNILLDIEERVYIERLINNLKLFYNKGYWENITISRDSTASTFQLWSIALKLKSPDNSKYFNLNEDEWFDSYYYIIKLYKENHKISSGLESLMKRKIWKKIIMTVNYNVTEWRSFEYLKEALKEDVDGRILLEKPDNIDKIRLLHSSFYIFLQERIFDILFLINKKKYIDEVKEKGFIKLQEGDYYNRINLIYYNTRSSTKNIIFNKERWRFSIKYIIEGELDDKKTMRSLPANIIQAMDANFAAYIISKIDCYVIHDSFIFNISDIGSIIDESNNYFNNLSESSNYSIFIIK